MKKFSVFTGMFLFAGAMFAQTRHLETVSFPTHLSPSRATVQDAMSGGRSLTCQDTLSYTLIKQQALFGVGWETNFGTFSVWQADGEAVSQTFLHSGGSATITGVEFLGYKLSGAPATVTARASVYSVDASNNPVTLLGSGTTVISSTTANFYVINLTAPVTVTSNYAIVLEATNTNGKLGFYTTSIDPGETMDEDLERYKSNYYPNSAGAWVSTLALTTGDATNFPGNPYDFEPIVAPIVNYSINTSFTTAPSPVCLGTPVTFTNTTTPSAFLSNRFYTFGSFMDYFNLWAADSTYAWDMDDTSPLIWSTNTSHSFASAGTYDVTLYTLGGFWSACTDFSTTPVVVNTVDNPAFSYASNTLCSGAPNTTPATSSAGTFSATPAGLVFVSTSTGEIDMTSSADGSYTVTYTTTGVCSATSSQTFTITSAPLADFSYASTEYCINGTNPSVTLDPGASAGSYSAGAGLSINSGTGEINLAGSTPGTYTVTNAIAASGSCLATSATFDVTIHDIPAVSFASSSVCEDAASVTLTGTPAGGTFSGTGVTGNQFDPSAGTQPITYSYTDANGCSNSAVATITVNTLPVVSFASDSLCSGTASVSLTATPAGGTFSGTGVTGNNFDPASGTQTLTYTYTDANGCINSANALYTVVPVPTVSWTSPGTVCVSYADFTLTGATPAGGTYSGTGVTGGQFSPATAGVGTHTITYSYTAEGCTGTTTGDIVVSECLGLENEGNAPQVSFYPNPSQGLVTFSFSHDKDVQLSVITSTGQVVFTGVYQTNMATVDMSGLAKGIYYVQVSVNGQMANTKLILQ